MGSRDTAGGQGPRIALNPGFPFRNLSRSFGEKSMVGLPTKKSKVLRFQICFTRTKYLSEIYKKRTIKVGAAKLFSVNSS